MVACHPCYARGVSSATTLLRLDGADALDFVNRLGTQALLDLAPGEARWTLFCEFRGRLLHRALAVRTTDGALWLIRDDAPGEGLAGYLTGHVFREDVRVAAPRPDLVADLVPAAPGETPGVTAEEDGAPRRIVLESGLAMAIEPAKDSASDAIGEADRILRGLSRHGREIAEAFHPFEVNLAADVHLAKGCYPGQEALQRLITYNSVRRRLALVGGSGAPPATPAGLACEGARAGALTSATRAGTDRWIGLAVIRNEDAEAGHALELDGRAVAIAEAFPVACPLGRP
jgi:folate-binding protein YgfZ